VRKPLLTQVAPPGVTANVVDVAAMIRVYNTPTYAGARVILLFTNPTDVDRLVDGSVEITSGNVGVLAFRPVNTPVDPAVSVDE
ncbi:PTS sugar transporter subunit IIB, partial [Escherichia coli]|uniref:PTS sugar transporter subunit IIB n=1 Tax=Escherichia coli TaxID=562 RepID=UPI00127E895D